MVKGELLPILKDNGLIKSINEGRRLIDQCAVSFVPKGAPSVRILVTSPEWTNLGGVSGTIRVGKRRFLRIVSKYTLVWKEDEEYINIKWRTDD